MGPLKYKIGDVARILGISPDLLRYYEKKGVVAPEKNRENSYRYYDAWDINFLTDCLWFKNFGFSIEQVAEIVRIPSAEELSELFLGKEEELRGTIRRCELLLRRSIEHREALKRSRELLQLPVSPVTAFLVDVNDQVVRAIDVQTSTSTLPPRGGAGVLQVIVKLRGPVGRGGDHVPGLPPTIEGRVGDEGHASLVW